MDEGLIARRTILSFIVLMGIVSMFSDITHEGATSIIGAYLSLAGASAAMIGFVSGLGGLIGYSLRIVTGILADRTRSYWLMTILGYILDCVAIPALALIPNGGWQIACVLIVLQRIGKAVKKPAKDTLLSFAAAQYGAGKSFAIQELLDQIGAFVGPVILFLILWFQKGNDTFSSYRICLAILGIPALVTILLLFYAKRKFPNPEKFEPDAKNPVKLRMNHAFVLYLIAISLFSLGFLDFPLITMHTAKRGLLSDDFLPLIYAVAMLLDAVAALVFGWLFDKYGLKILMLSTLIAAPFALFVFGGSTRWTLFIGVSLWGIGMGAQESVLKAAVTSLVPKGNRSTGYGVFQTAFGICLFLGSWLMGVLYDVSIPALIAFSVLTQLVAIPFFYFSGRETTGPVCPKSRKMHP